MQYLCDLYVDEMGSMQRLIRREDEDADLLCRTRLEENLKDRGSIDNDQRFFLSARTAAVGAGCGLTG